MIDLSSPADQMATVVGGITDDQLDNPTPCAPTRVRGLLSHVLGLCIAFRDAAAKIEGPTTSTRPGGDLPPLDPAWRERIPQLLGELVEAWRAPEAWTGMTMAGGLELPGADAGMVASNELLVHGWDLAVATGQPFSAAEDNLRASYEFCSQTPDDPDVRAGLFGPVVPVPDDAPLLDRTLGYAGRHSNWQPPT